MKKIIILRGTFLVTLALLISIVGCTCGSGPTGLTVTTVKSDLVTENSATLYGHLEIYGPDPTFAYKVYFEWGLSDNTMDRETLPETENSTVDFIQTINNLTPNTTYSFRAMAADHEGQPLDHDQILHFTTESTEPEKLTILTQFNEVWGINILRISGQAKNTSGEQLSYAEIEVRILDDQGEVLHADTDSIDGLNRDEVWDYEVIWEGTTTSQWSSKVSVGTVLLGQP